MRVDDTGVKLRAPKRLLAAAEAQRAKLREAVMTRHRVTHRADGKLVYDVGGIALDAREQLRPVAAGMGTLVEARELAERAMLFVQKIPYARAQGFTFRTPLAVVRDHRGDCDEKVALFAAILRAHEPTLPIAVISIEGHAFVGIDLFPHGTEQTVTVGGRTWLVAEPVGPSLLPLGRISERSAEALREDRYHLTLVPPAR